MRWDEKIRKLLKIDSVKTQSTTLVSNEFDLNSNSNSNHDTKNSNEIHEIKSKWPTQNL